MKLTKRSRALLDEIGKLPPNNNGIFYTVDYVAKNSALPIQRDALIGILDTLAESNHIKWGDEQRTAFRLTETGRAHKQIRRLESRERWSERVWGFLFGIAATILTQFVMKKCGL